MARLQVFVETDMSSVDFSGDTISASDVTLTEASANRIAAKYKGFEEVFIGSFTYDYFFGEINGRVRIYEYKSEGDLITRITDLNLDAYTVFFETDFSRPDDVYTLFFSGSDTFIGSNFDDYLISHTGNDTVFGGTGADTLEGGSGQDRLEGQDGNDRLLGGVGNDYLFGGAGADAVLGGEGADNMFGEGGADNLDGGVGNDSIYGGSGNDYLFGDFGEDFLVSELGDDTLVGGEAFDVLIGGGGTDMARYSGAQSNYRIELTNDGSWISDKRASGDGVDKLTEIEVLSFADQNWTLEAVDDVVSLSETELREFIEVYIAYFNRAPDAEGLFFYGTAFANGTSLAECAATFLNSTEYQSNYPSNLSNQQFAEAVYNNVLGRIPDAEGLQFWVNVLDSGARSRDVFILEVLQGAKAPSPADASQAFIDQKAADLAYLSNKTDVGLYFSVTKGMSNVTNATTAMQLFDDGDPADINAAKAAIDSFYTNALDPTNGEFLLQLVGVADDPFVV